MTVQDTKLVVIILEDIKRMVKEKDPKVIDAIDACIKKLESRQPQERSICFFLEPQKKYSTQIS